MSGAYISIKIAIGFLQSIFKRVNVRAAD